jgi:hypothetical protein
MHKLPKPKEVRFYVKDPEILWKKIFCPICGEPTGEKSRCYENPPEDIPASKRKLVHKKMGILPIYSKSCIYRQDNLWEAHLNYPASAILIKKLKQIRGIERIVAVKSHALQVSIGTLFNELEVKQQINTLYKTFFKELQAIESNLYGSHIDCENSKLYTGILLPNGTEWKQISTASKEEAEKQSGIIENLLENLPESKGILSNKLENGSREPYTKEKENTHGN